MAGVKGTGLGRRLAILLATALAAFAAATSAPAAQQAAAAALKSCSSGWRHAVIGVGVSVGPRGTKLSANTRGRRALSLSLLGFFFRKRL
jgi:hypothetical protein